MENIEVPITERNLAEKIEVSQLHVPAALPRLAALVVVCRSPHWPRRRPALLVVVDERDEERHEAEEEAEHVKEAAEPFPRESVRLVVCKEQLHVVDVHPGEQDDQLQHELRRRLQKPLEKRDQCP